MTFKLRRMFLIGSPSGKTSADLAFAISSSFSPSSSLTSLGKYTCPTGFVFSLNFTILPLSCTPIQLYGKKSGTTFLVK